MKACVVQPPLKSMLHGSDERLNPAGTHDAAVLAEAGWKVSILNLEANPDDQLHRGWAKLSDASWALSDVLASDAREGIEEKARERLATEQPDVVVVESGDWAVPAKDLSDPIVDLWLGLCLREMKCRTVCVGSHCTFNSAPFLEVYDAVVKGVPGRALLSAVSGKNGSIEGRGPEDYRHVMPHLNSLWPNGADLSRVISEFGCPWGRCSFCPSALMYDGVCVAKDNDVFVRDVARRPEHRISIVDNYFAHDLARLRELAPRLGKLDREYVVDCRCEVADRPEALRLLRKMGTRMIKIGIESLSDQTLHCMEKKQTAAEVTRRVDTLVEKGFEVFAYLLLGTPCDSTRNMEQTLKRAEELAGRVSWLPNFFCEPGDLDPRTHHFSRPQARRLGIPDELVERALALCDQPDRQTDASRSPHCRTGSADRTRRAGNLVANGET